ncbi:hypothetical protein AGMMS49949_05100 [Alphaproteobacteria bacterium]|nr:hypothetical protein AGMMS49949_05100 [Alphaproteobacteria bacterium]GHT00102.1 hypothetical protein AGMMS50296_8350 [Alphaproteobacteria bacterium]
MTHFFKEKKDLFFVFFLSIFFSTSFSLILSHQAKGKKDFQKLGIAIVDGARLKTETLPCIRFQEIFQKESKALNANIQKAKESLEKLSELAKDPKLSQAKRAEYRKKFHQEFARIGPQIQKSKDELKQKMIDFQEKINLAVVDVTQSLSGKYQLRLILNAKVMDKMSVFYASPTLDITDEAIEMVNKEFEKIRHE